MRRNRFNPEFSQPQVTRRVSEGRLLGFPVLLTCRVTGDLVTGRTNHGSCRALIATIAILLGSPIDLAAEETFRRLDSVTAPKRWTTGELSVDRSQELLASDRPTLRATVNIDHKNPATFPVGYPRMYLPLTKNEKDWQQFDRLEFQLLGKSTRPRPNGMPVIFQVLCPDKLTGATVSIRVPKPNTWVRVSLPIRSISQVEKLSNLLVYLGEKHYEHGEKLEFYFGDFRLIGSAQSNRRTTNAKLKYLTIQQLYGPPATEVLDRIEGLEGWQVSPGGKIEIDHSAAVGSRAVHFEFPGAASKKLQDRPWLQRRQWDRAKGLRFWVKGDGCKQFGCLSVSGWGGRMSYIAYFPLTNKDWHQVTIPWTDFAPQGQFKPLSSRGGLRPSGIDSIGVGDRWKLTYNNQSFPSFIYSIDEIRIAADMPPPRPTPKILALSKVIQRMRHGKTVRIVCLGDSITAGAALTKPDEERYAVRLQAKLRKSFANNEIHVESRGVGGARVTDARAWVPRDLAGQPPDLVTILYGYNDKKSYTADFFEHSLSDYVDRIARKTSGRTAVLLMTPLPGKAPAFTLLDDFADSVRNLARVRQLDMFDLNQLVKKLGSQEEIESRYFADVAHPNAAGQELIATLIAKFLESL